MHFVIIMKGFQNFKLAMWLVEERRIITTSISQIDIHKYNIPGQVHVYVDESYYKVTNINTPMSDMHATLSLAWSWCKCVPGIGCCCCRISADGNCSKAPPRKVLFLMLRCLPIMLVSYNREVNSVWLAWIFQHSWICLSFLEVGLKLNETMHFHTLLINRYAILSRLQAERI